MISTQAFQQVISSVSSINQVTYLCNQHRIRNLLSKQKTVKKKGKEGEIRRYGYKAMANAFFSFLKPTRHLVRLRTRETIFLKAFTLLPNLNKYTHHIRK